MAFEFDERKSRANKAKHGIDFVEAQALWLDEALVEAPARSATAKRVSWLWGVMAGRHWSAFITYRNEEHPVDFRSPIPPEEVAIYEGQ